MADKATFPLSFIMKAVDQATAPIMRVGRSLGTLGKIGRSAFSIAGNIANATGISMRGVVTGAISAAKDAGLAMTRIRTITGIGADEAENLRRQLLSIPGVRAIGLDAATDALARMVEETGSAESGLRLVSQAIGLAAAESSDVGEMVRLLDDLSDSMQLTDEQMGRMAQTVAQARGAVGKNINDIFSQISEAGVNARAAGRSLDEVTEAVLAMQAAGVPNAGAALKDAFKDLAALGLNDTTRSIVQISEALVRSGQISKLFTGKLGGSKSGGALTALGRFGTAGLANLRAEIAKRPDLAFQIGVADTSLAAQMNDFNNSIKELLLTIANSGLVDVLKELVGVMRSGLEWARGKFGVAQALSGSSYKPFGIGLVDSFRSVFGSSAQSQKVLVQFKDTPAGTKVESRSPNIDTDVGYRVEFGR